MSDPSTYDAGTATTQPPPSPDDSVPRSPRGSVPPALAPGEPAARPGRRAARRPTRISALRTGLIAGLFVLILLVIFLIQNTATVQISFLGAHVRMSLAVALLIAAIAGALLMVVAGTARITQLRRNLRRARRASPSEGRGRAA
jgi:putative membrane protein